jgi:peptide/nickel transport system permease protein
MTDSNKLDAARDAHRTSRPPLLIAGGALLGLLMLFGFLGGPLWKHRFTTMEFGRHLAPSLDHPLGTDLLGADMMAQLIRGTRTSIQLAIVVTVLAAAIGVALAALDRLASSRGLSPVRWLIGLTLVALPVVSIVALLRTVIVRPAEYGRVSLHLSDADWLWLAPILVLILGITAVRAIRRRMPPTVPDLVAADIGLAVAFVVMYKERLPQYSTRLPEVTLGGAWTLQRYELHTHPQLLLAPAVVVVLLALAVYLVFTGLGDLLDSDTRWRARPLADPAAR